MRINNYEYISRTTSTIIVAIMVTLMSLYMTFTSSILGSPEWLLIFGFLLLCAFSIESITTTFSGEELTITRYDWRGKTVKTLSKDEVSAVNRIKQPSQTNKRREFVTVTVSYLDKEKNKFCQTPNLIVQDFLFRQDPEFMIETLTKWKLNQPR